MTAVGRLAIVPTEQLTRQQILDKLAYWREHLVEWDSGLANLPLTRTEITVQLDKYLDALSAWHER